MHAAKLPFTGLIVSSLAITCIILIAYYVPSKHSILKATVIVAIFKLMLSPYSPPTAYIAVFFQGMMGQLLFSSRRYFNFAAIILAVLALVESAIQRILVLVIVYGNNFWKAVNEFIRKLINEKNTTNYSLIIAVSYILLHAVIGVFVGIYAARLAKRSVSWKNRYPSYITGKEQTVSPIVTRTNKKRKRLKLIFTITWIGLLALYIQSYIYPTHAIIPANIIVNILLRSFMIVLSWFLIVAPLLMMLIRRLLSTQRHQYKQEVSEVMLLIPQTRYIFKQSFRLSENKKGLKRVKLFLKILLINVLAD